MAVAFRSFNARKLGHYFVGSNHCRPAYSYLQSDLEVGAAVGIYYSDL